MRCGDCYWASESKSRSGWGGVRDRKKRTGGAMSCHVMSCCLLLLLMMCQSNTARLLPTSKQCRHQNNEHLDSHESDLKVVESVGDVDI